MRSLEISSIPLYHGTSIKQGLSILADGYLRGSKRENDQHVGISTTRDKTLWFNGVQRDAGQIMFVFDRNQLQTRFKVVPFDYFNPDEYESDQYRRRESEEIILTEQLPLRFVLRVMVDDSIWPEEKDELETLAKMNDIKIEYVARIFREDKEKDTLELPILKVGDEIKIGRWKNRKAIIKGFKKDKNNHPIMKTNKGDQQVFKARISKLMPEKLKEFKMMKVYDDYHDEEIKVAVNPNWQVLQTLLARSNYDDLRALFSGGKFYFWDADIRIHAAMAKIMGIPYDPNMRMGLSYRNSGQTIVLDHGEEILGFLKQHPYIDRNFDIEDQGWESLVLKRGEKQ